MIYVAFITIFGNNLILEAFMDGTDTEKPLAWIGSSKADLLDLPRKAQRNVGYALYLAQLGLEHTNVKPLTGFGGRGVLEVVEDDAAGTYRAVYTVKFKEAIYVLHAFQKKSKKGKETPKEEMEIVKTRLKIAEHKHKEWLKKVKK
jgi:phage-related protein